MFDHVTLRVPDLATARTALAVVLNELDIPETRSTLSFSVWGNFALTQTDDDHPVARRVHIAFIAPTPAHVDRFGRAGTGPAATGRHEHRPGRRGRAPGPGRRSAHQQCRPGRAPGELTGEAIVDVARREMEVNYFG